MSEELNDDDGGWAHGKGCGKVREQREKERERKDVESDLESSWKGKEGG